MGTTRQPATAIHVFFFRGLSTYGSDRLRFSFIDLGPTQQPLVRALSKRGIEVHAVMGMGAGPLRQVASRAMSYLATHEIWRDEEQPVHFLGHSAGGLIARLNALESQRRNLISCVTMATPNSGSSLAKICVEMPDAHQGSARFLKTLGYDLRRKRNFFSELTKESVTSLFHELMTPPSAACSSATSSKASALRRASVVCFEPRHEWCLPLRLAHTLPALRDFRSLSAFSDGLVERDTQPFGDVIAEVAIDHFCQIGIFGERQKFEKLCDVLARFFSLS